MNDDERIAQLTKLARKAWPGLDVRISAAPGYATVLGGAAGQEASEWRFILLSVAENPRAVDALEAALQVLVSGETWANRTAELDKCLHSLHAITDTCARITELEATLDKVRSALVGHSPSEVLAILDDKEQS